MSPARGSSLAHSARRIGLHEEYLPDLYLQSVRWVSEILAEAVPAQNLSVT
jgi:hypothetical protein